MSLDATRWAWLLDIRPTQKLILLSLADRADERHMCWPSLRRLAQDTGFDERTISTAIKQLCEDGYLKRWETPGKGYTYALVGVPGREDTPRNGCTPLKTVPPAPDVPPPPSIDAGDPPQLTQTHHKKESKKESPKNHQSRARAKTDGSPDFKTFWNAYPKKVGKKAAIRAWDNARDKPDVAAILAAIAHQRASPQWQRDGGQYIPNPATWLNQGRWDDQPVDAAVAIAPKLAEARSFVARYGEGHPAMERKALEEFCRSKNLPFAEYATLIFTAGGCRAQNDNGHAHQRAL